MAISIRGSAGAWTAANATTQTRTLPTHAAGDMLIVRVAHKHSLIANVPTCATSGWNLLGSYANGTSASSNGGGSVRVTVFYKIAESAAEPSPVITYHASVSATPAAACAVVYQKDASDTWETPEGAGGSFTAATAISSTISSHVSTTAGDMVDFFAAACDNNTRTVPSFTQAGLTLGTVSEQPAAALSSATSNDINADGGYRLATAGTSSAAAVVTGTQTAADAGSAWTTRLRVQSVTTVEQSFTADAHISKLGIAGSFTADANIKKNDIAGSFTADAYILKVTAGSFTADANISKTLSGSFTADAYIEKTTSQSVTADAYIKRTIAGAFTADAQLAQLVTTPGTFTADAAISKTLQSSYTADAYVQRITSGTFTANANVQRTFASSFTADSHFSKTTLASFTAEAYIQGTAPSGPVWVSPPDTDAITPLPVLVFTIPAGPVGNYHFNIELDMVATFDGGDYRSLRTNVDQTGWEYWNDTAWVPVTSAGVASTYAGNNARYTVQSPLATGVWYRRVRVGV